MLKVAMETWTYSSLENQCKNKNPENCDKLNDLFVERAVILNSYKTWCPSGYPYVFIGGTTA